MILAADTGEVGTMGAALLDTGIKSAGVLVMAAVAAGCMRRQSAAARHMVWFLSVLGLLALPVLSWALPGWNVLPQWTNPRPVVAVPSTPIQQTTPVSQQTAVASTPAESSRNVIPQNAPSVNNNLVSATVVQPATATAKSSTPTPAPRRIAWKPLLVPLWLVGTAVAVSPTLLGLLSLWHLERRSRREQGFAWIELLRHLMARVGLARPVALLKTGNRRMPMTWGVVRPKLLLPEEAEEWPEERRRVVMLHELAHAKRWDYLSNLLTQIVCAVYWFNPLVWFAARQMVKERERACDDIVLNNGSKPADYAEQVLQIAAGLPSGGTFAVYSGIAMARQSSLEGRLRAILDRGRNRKSLTRMVVLVAAAMGAMVVGALAMLSSAQSNTVRVVDAETHAPIPKFVVTPGDGRAAFDMLTWDTNRSAAGTNGVLTLAYPTDPSWQQLKVEAPGYMPEMKSKGFLSTNRVIELRKGTGISGRVVDWDGKVVQQAQVAFNVKYGRVSAREGKLQIPGPPRVHRSPLVNTDADGRFYIPAVAGIISLVVFGEGGFAEVPWESLETNMTIRLQPRNETAKTAEDLGFHVLLRTNGIAQGTNRIPLLAMDIRNSAGSAVLSSTNSRLWRMEIDGKWYGRLFETYNSPLKMLGPGESWTNIPVGIGEAWHSVSSGLQDFSETIFADDGGWLPLAWNAERLMLTPGKHTVRMAVYAARPGTDTVGVVRAVSKPVEVEIPTNVGTKAASQQTNRTVRIVAIGRPDRSAALWWDTNGQVVMPGPVFIGRSPAEAFVVAIDRAGIEGTVDFTIRTTDKNLDGIGSGIKGDAGSGIVSTMIYLTDTPEKKVRDYLDGGGRIDLVVKHGIGWWTETAVVYPGQTVTTNGGRFGLGKIEAIREATRTGLLWTSRMPGLMLIDGRYDFDSGYEIAWVAVDKQGKRTPIVDSTGGGMFQSNTNRRVFHHVQMGRTDLDHFLVLSRPVKETVYRGIPTKVGMKSSIDPAKTKEREAVAKAEWGEGVEGVQVRAAYVGMRSNAPALLADLRNGGTVGVQVSENAFRWRVEVDGVWYRFNTNGAQLLTIVPGETRTNIEVMLDGNWMKAAPSEMNPAMFGGGGGGGIPRDFARDPLKFSPGKHTVRFGMMTRIVRLGAGAVLAMSKPVEVDVPQGGESAATKVPESFKIPTDAVLQSWLSQSELVVVAKRKITRVVRDGRPGILTMPGENNFATFSSKFLTGYFEVLEVIKGEATVGSNILASVNRPRTAPDIPGLESDTGESVILFLTNDAQNSRDLGPWKVASRDFGAQPADPELLKALRAHLNADNGPADVDEASSVPDATTLKALTDSADFVFAGRVVRIPFVTSAEGESISEHVTDFHVSSVFKGEVPESKAVRVLLKRFSKAGLLKDGDDLVIFLKRGNAANNEAYGATFDMDLGIQRESPALTKTLTTLTRTSESAAVARTPLLIADDATLRSNFAKAELVIVGKATNSDGAVGNLSTMLYDCETIVGEVIKGDATPGSKIRTAVDVPRGMSVRTVQDGDELVLFLKREKMGGGGGFPLDSRMRTIDHMFGVQTATPELIAKLKTMARPQAGESAMFGPVMEQDVPAFTYGNPRSLDLDTGQMVAGHPPGDIEFLLAESDSRVRHALDMVTVGVDSNKWDATAAEVLAALAGVAPQKQARLGSIESRRTYFFKTQEGAAGVLQVLPTTNMEVKIRYKLIKSQTGGGGTAINEAGWGEALQGLSLRLAKDGTRSNAPALRADLRNNGTVGANSSANPFRWRVEVDGVWYSYNVNGGPMQTIAAGETVTNLAIVLDGQWQKAAESEMNMNTFGAGGGGGVPANFVREPLKLTPGKHTVRFAMIARISRLGAGAVLVVSKPVEIEVAK